MYQSYGSRGTVLPLGKGVPLMDTPPKHITTRTVAMTLEKLHEQYRRKSKHWANFVHRPMGGDKEEFAARAEDRFFEWLLGDQHA